MSPLWFWFTGGVGGVCGSGAGSGAGVGFLTAKGSGGVDGLGTFGSSFNPPFLIIPSSILICPWKSEHPAWVRS